MHGEDSGARRALRGWADADPGRGSAALQAQQHPRRQALLRRGRRVPRGGAGGGGYGARGGVHRPPRAGRGGGDRGLGRDRDTAAVQEPLVRDRRTHRVRPGGQAADPGAYLGEGTPGEGQGAPLRCGREARARAAGPREGPEERPPARRLAPGRRVDCYTERAMLRTVIITGAISFAILVVILYLTLTVRPTLESEYLEFGLALAMFLVILLGSYWFIVRGPGRYM